MFTNDDGKNRQIQFFKKDGTRTEGWKNDSGTAILSVMKIYSELFPSFEGREVNIPDGHQIVGFAVKKDSKGNIIWVDFKTWKPPRRT